MLELFKKYKEVISYLFFGVCTTGINFIIFWILCGFLSPAISNICAWIVSIVFSFVTSKKFVFETKGNAVKEAIEFVGTRIFAFFLDEGLLLFLIELLTMNNILAKAITSILVIVVNYLTSKFLVFSKRGDNWWKVMQN